MRLVRRLTILIAPLSIGGIGVPAHAESVSGRSVDDDGVPGELHIETLAELGAIRGCNPPNNTMPCPERGLSRAEAFKVLVIAGQAYDVYRIPYRRRPSISSITTSYGAVQRRATATFSPAWTSSMDAIRRPILGCPDDPLTRAEAAKIVVTIFGLTAPDSNDTPWTDTPGRGGTTRSPGWRHITICSTRRMGGSPAKMRSTRPRSPGWW